MTAIASPTCGAPVGRRDRSPEGPGELGEGVPAERPRAQAGRVLEVPRPGEDPHHDRREQGRVLLSRRARREDGQVRPRDRRRAAQGRPRRAQARLGRSDRPHLSRHDPARDPAVGSGHRRADGAGHPRELRRGRPRSRQRRDGASAHRGDEARLRRHLALRVRPALHGSDAQADARQGLPEEPRQADRSEEGARISDPARPRTAARSISARPTPRA